MAEEESIRHPPTDAVTQISSASPPVLNEKPQTLPQFALRFPPAAQPDIIRSNQKDLHYQNVLQDQVHNVFRQIFGTRTQHLYQNELNLLSDLCYFTLTTLMGTQTLGEEYCDILQVYEKTQTYPSALRRAVLIFWHVLLPYIYIRASAELRRSIRARQPQPDDKTHWKERFRSFAYKVLPWITDFAKTHLHSAHLAVFFFWGSYYSWSKRVTGIRYIFARYLLPHEQHPGYEILGILITIQLLIQSYLHLREQEREIDRAKKGDLLDDYSDSESSDVDEDEMQMEKYRNFTSDEIQAIKCTLCLSPRKHTTSTPCGHLFCWSCITEWCGNKPECPLCRQHVNISHLLPLYNY